MDRSRAWKLTASTHPWAVQKTWTIRNRYGYRYAKICIFPTVSLLNGRRLARLCDIRTWYGKKDLVCLTLLSCKVTSRGRCNSLSCNKRNIVVSNLNFGSTSPARGGLQNLQQIKRHDGRQPHTLGNKRHDGRQPHTHLIPCKTTASQRCGAAGGQGGRRLQGGVGSGDRITY